MVKKKSEQKTVGPICWTGTKFVSMPEDLTTHASMSVEEIDKQPEIFWNEETNQWEFK
jgi:hypothetical protein